MSFVLLSYHRVAAFKLILWRVLGPKLVLKGKVRAVQSVYAGVYYFEMFLVFRALTAVTLATCSRAFISRLLLLQLANPIASHYLVTELFT